MFKKIGIGLAVLGVVSFGVWVRFIHPRDRHRGATEEEVHRPLPGDEQVPAPVVRATRAITIDAPPEQVWPELVQIGYRSASRDVFKQFDHDHIPSAEELTPTWRQFDGGPQIGKEGFTVQAIEPPRLLLLTSHAPKTERGGNIGIWPSFSDGSWAFVLEPTGEGHTRLITQVRYAFSPGVPFLWRPLIKGVHLLLQSRILLRIKHRVEGRRSVGQREGVLPFGNKENQSRTNPVRETSSVWGFFLLTYAIMVCTWGLMVLFQLKGISSSSNAPKPSPGEVVLFLLGACSPSLAGILMTWRVEGPSGLRALWRRAIKVKLGWKWYVVTCLPLFMALLLVGVYLLLGGVLNETAPIFRFLSLMSFTLGIFVVGPLTEECGWRGFALDRLLAGWEPLGASLLLGLLWGLWHVPLYFIPNSIELVPLPVFLTSIMSQSVLMTWVYLATRQSFWSVIWFHFTANYAEALLRALTGGARVYPLLLHGFFVAMGARVALTWYGRSPARALVH